MIQESKFLPMRSVFFGVCEDLIKTKISTFAKFFPLCLAKAEIRKARKVLGKFEETYLGKLGELGNRLGKLGKF